MTQKYRLFMIGPIYVNISSTVSEIWLIIGPIFGIDKGASL